MTHASSTQAIKRLSKQKPVLHDWAMMTQQTCLIGHLLVELLKGAHFFDYQMANKDKVVEIICVKSVKADCLGLKAESFFEMQEFIISLTHFARNLC